MATQALLTFDTIGMAYNFLDDLEDENPRVWGLDRLVMFPRRGVDGVYRVTTAADPEDYRDDYHTSLAPDYEDTLIARLDGELDEDDDDDTFDRDDLYAYGDVTEEEPWDDGPSVPTLPAEPEVECEAAEVIPTRERCGRAPRTPRVVFTTQMHRVAVTVAH
jgi:hypothetical protein